MKTLYMIGLGGHLEGANIEVHDVQFVYQDSIEASYDTLINRWYGNQLHLDSYTEITVIDKYKLIPSEQCDVRLYCIVYGGYKTAVIDELHRYHFVLAKNKIEAKQIGKKDITSFAHMDHVDAVIDVFENANQCFDVQEGPYSFRENKTTHTFVILKE